ncbi:MAG TPA: patatin-like phospholipase family protein [Gemmatimonadales bacterium]|nr:patatin-like phospholipase family protein [Gemmatimonadales bacterium]
MGSDHGGPRSLNQVLVEELTAIRGGFPDGIPPEPQGDSRLKATDPAAYAEAKARRLANLRRMYQALGSLPRPLSALCLSGGGIRSATFSLGVLQGLAARGVLKDFDYLSSVSGGGYIAGWLSAWLSRQEHPLDVYEDLSRQGREGDGTPVPPLNPLSPEADPLDALREYSNYLTPRLGLFSGDTWTLVALFLRNLLLNWLVLLPAMGVVIALPQLAFLALQTDWWTDADAWARYASWVLMGAVGLALMASFLVHYLRERAGAKGPDLARIVRLGILPLWGATLLLAIAGYWLPGTGIGRPDPAGGAGFPTSSLVWFSLVWSVALPLIGWLFAQVTGPRMARNPIGEGLALVCSGLAGAALLTWTGSVLLPQLRQYPGPYAVLALPILLLIYLTARVLFVAFASAGEGLRPRGTPAGEPPSLAVRTEGDREREWWARLSAWIVIAGVAWCALAIVSLMGAHLLQALGKGIPSAVAGAGGIAGIVTVWLARSEKSASGRREDEPRSKLMRYGIAIGSALFCLCLGLLIGLGTMALGRTMTGEPSLFTGDYLFTPAWISRATLARVALVPLALAALSITMSRFVNVNRFSLHALYRDRLVRAYLGASNLGRRPDPFTGFADDDDLPLTELRNVQAEPPLEHEVRAPLLVINTALNLVRTQRKLAWQQRKAESFSMTPLYCGNFYEGYRPTAEYAGGISLGTAMTISGAAANPSMGYHSSATVTFLLGLFNARLGAWLGNTNQRGDSTWQLAGPRWAAATLLADLLGYTDANNKYVNLSDGGHFDNLGLYEMVLRRVRNIVVCDAGSDASFHFEDLGNAIRKIRIDFGVSIDFEPEIRILPKDGTGGPGLYCAFGTINYQCVDGSEVSNGRICYIKPTVRGRSHPPYDVTSYSRGSPPFPHETTADQWFDESQFESYRALGVHAIKAICGDAAVRSLEDFMRLAEAGAK